MPGGESIFEKGLNFDFDGDGQAEATERVNAFGAFTPLTEAENRESDDENIEN